MTTDTALDAPVRLRSPADLLVAIPVLLGFPPRDSLVVICLRGPGDRRVGLTLRVDLPPPDELPALAAQLVRMLRRSRPRRVALAVIGGQPRRAHRDGPPRRDVADQLGAAFERAGIAVIGRCWAAELTAGAGWCCYDRCGCAGTLADPRSAPVAAAAVAAGQALLDDRAELGGLVAPVDAAALARRSARLDAALDAAAVDDALAGKASRSRDLRLVRTALAEVAEGRLVLGDDDVVRLAVALSDPHVRDACIALTLGADAPRAEQLWAALTREAPDPEAAEPATLLAVAAFMRGDGGLANVALERAQRAWPGHRLSLLLDSAISGGLAPAQVRAALTGRSISDLAGDR